MRKIYLPFMLLIFLIYHETSGIKSSNCFCKKTLTKLSQRLLAVASVIEVHKLGSEINSAKSCEYPIYISESNSGLVYYTEIKNNESGIISQEFYYSKFNNADSTWEKPINIKTEYAKFYKICKTINLKEIFITIDNDIYSVDLNNMIFIPQKLNINTKGIERSPVLSPDKNTLYFVSDRKGGYGGTDIWASERLSNGNWSEPYNLGKLINTAEDEESPFIMNDGVTLYFSSKGHNSMGGFDIFVTTQNDEGIWSLPENIGAPINSTADDFYYVTDSYGKVAYYSSDKNEKGKQDIFFVKYNSFGK